MGKIVGIDLGTTNSLVATVDSGIPLVIADAQGRRLTPSVVHFGEGDPTVGHEARRIRTLQPERTVFSIKRFMGRRGGDISPQELAMPYAVKAEGRGAVRVQIAEREYSPEEVSAEILRKLKADAEAYLGETVERAVITVPAYFNDAQRTATKQAGELAGFQVERIINEPTAAALAYGLNRLKEKSKLAVYDFGGGTFDLSILELSGGVFQVLATSGDTLLGGDDLDRRIMEHLLRRVSAAGGPRIEPMTGPRVIDGTTVLVLSRLREEAEAAKIRLSSVEETDITLPFLTPDFSFSERLTRAQLEDLTRDIITRTRAHCLRALADAKLEAKDLDR